MKIIITAADQDILSEWADAMADLPEVSTSSHRPPTVSADAIVIAGQFAFDRYGGRPRRTFAQILLNRCNDGFPGIIVIPPYRPLRREPGGPSRAAPGWEDVSPAYHAISRSMSAVLAWNSSGRRTSHSIENVVMDLGLLGMNIPSDHSTPKTVGAALRETVSEGGHRSISTLWGQERLPTAGGIYFTSGQCFRGRLDAHTRSGMSLSGKLDIEDHLSEHPNETSDISVLAGQELTAGNGEVWAGEIAEGTGGFFCHLDPEGNLMWAVVTQESHGFDRIDVRNGEAIFSTAEGAVVTLDVEDPLASLARGEEPAP